MSCLCVVDHILDILNQPFGGLSGLSNFPQIGGDVDEIESAAVNVPPTVSFVNGKHEVCYICLFSQQQIPL